MNGVNHFLTVDEFKELNFLNEAKKTFDLILESLATARNLYLKTGKISQDIFSELVGIDPSKQKKYLEKLCSFYLDDNNTEKIKELILVYDNLVTKNQINDKDISKFKSFHDFKSVIDKNKDKQSKTSSKNLIKSKDAEIILDNDKFLVVLPKTHEASCIYGAGTKWCTASREPYYWKLYESNFVKFYYIIRKNEDVNSLFYKIAVAVFPDGKKECYDAEDHSTSFEYVLFLTKLDKKLFKTDKPNLEKIIKSWFKGEYDVNGGVYNTKGDVKIEGWKEEQLPIKFGSVGGQFVVRNTKLTTMENFPFVVRDTFFCVGNKKLDIKVGLGLPKKVDGDFIYQDNKDNPSSDDILMVCRVMGKIIANDTWQVKN